jgi:phospholipid/cholesterol/gamma-HCH transport system permease protein
MTISTPLRAPFDWKVIDGTHAQLVLQGRIDVYTLGGNWTVARQNQDAWLGESSGQKTLSVDASQVDYLDGAGVAFLIDLHANQEKKGAAFTLLGLDKRYLPLLQQFDPIGKLFPPAAPLLREGFVTSVGRTSSVFFQDVASIIAFAGHVTADLVWALMHPRQVRWGDFVNAAYQAGVSALPIVGLVAFLIGVILSFQSAVGMQKFGAISFVGPIVALGIFRELGPLITAILLAGRSSAAFAAEIGTMTVNSEVDALVTGGLSPVRFLVVPRVLAGILVAPILTLYADIVSVFASSLTMMAYGVTLVSFYDGVLNTVDLEDILSGLTKSVLFGIVIAAVGCMRGMQTGTGAAAVGISATRAVVSSIVMIVLVDGVFAYISYKTDF